MSSYIYQKSQKPTRKKNFHSYLFMQEREKSTTTHLHTITLNKCCIFSVIRNIFIIKHNSKYVDRILKKKTHLFMAVHMIMLQITTRHDSGSPQQSKWHSLCRQWAFFPYTSRELEFINKIAWILFYHERKKMNRDCQIEILVSNSLMN